MHADTKKAGGKSRPLCVCMIAGLRRIADGDIAQLALGELEAIRAAAEVFLRGLLILIGIRKVAVVAMSFPLFSGFRLA